MNKKLEIINKENLKDYFMKQESDSPDNLFLHDDNDDNSPVIYGDTDTNSIWANIERDLDDFIENLLQ